MDYIHGVKIRDMLTGIRQETPESHVRRPKRFQELPEQLAAIRKKRRQIGKQIPDIRGNPGQAPPYRIETQLTQRPFG